jgi:uncharacterized protein
MQEKIEKSFLGTGWNFPPRFREQDRSLELVSEEDDIRQSLFLLIATAPGERIMNPEYGCDLNSLIFERISESLRHKIRLMVSRAIFQFEPRVIVENIDIHLVSTEPGILHIVVDYTVIQTNSRDNIVYPFYREEGTSIVL